MILQGDNSVGEFYTVAVVNNKQQADTGTKMIHIGRNTKSTIVSKGISAGEGNNSYRGRVQVLPKAAGARNYTQCDSMLVGNRCGAHTFPYIEVGNNTAIVEHEASTSKIGEDQIFYLKAARADRRAGGVDDRSAGSARKCSRSCRWSSRSKRSSCLGSRWKARRVDGIGVRIRPGSLSTDDSSDRRQRQSAVMTTPDGCR